MLDMSRLRGTGELFLGYFFVAVFLVVAAFLPAFSFTSWWLMRFLQVRNTRPVRRSPGLWRAFYAGEVGFGRFDQDERLSGGVSISQRPTR
jgi:hypothetical protein